MVRASGGHLSETQCTINQPFANPDSSRGIILSNERDNALEIIKSRIRDQDFVIHDATEAFTS